MIPAAPGLPTHSYYAAAMEDGSYAAAWTLYAWAICGNPIAGWEVRSNYAAVVPGNPSVHSLAFCQGGKKVVGTGGSVVGGYRFKLIYIVPGGGDYVAVSTGVAPDEGVTGTYRSLVVCDLRQPHRAADRLGQQHLLVGQQGPQRGLPSRHEGARDGRGGGRRTRRQWPVVGQLHLNRIGLFGAGALAGVDVAAHEDQTGYAGNWTTTVYAICAP